MTDLLRETPSIILASGSPRRRELLARLGLPFTVVTSGVEETLDESVPIAEAVAHLAWQKADAVTRRHDRGLVIGADTVVVYDNTALGKPEDAADAARMLSQLRDRWHEVITGVAVIDAETGRAGSSAVRTRVHMCPYADDEIASYVATGEPLDRAGAYAVQGLGGALIDMVDGCYANVVGLPLCEVADFLSQFGINALTSEAACALPSGKPCPRISMTNGSCVPIQDRLF